MRIRKKRTETISKTSTLLLLTHHSPGIRTGWCGVCEVETVWIAHEKIPLLGIVRLPEMEGIHTSGDEICSRSLMASIEEGEKKL